LDDPSLRGLESATEGINTRLDSLLPALGKGKGSSCISAEVDWLRTIPDMMGIVIIEFVFSWLDEEGNAMEEDKLIARHSISYFMLKSMKWNQFLQGIGLIRPIIVIGREGSVGRVQRCRPLKVGIVHGFHIIYFRSRLRHFLYENRDFYRNSNRGLLLNNNNFRPLLLLFLLQGMRQNKKKYKDSYQAQNRF